MKLDGGWSKKDFRHDHACYILLSSALSRPNIGYRMNSVIMGVCYS